MLGKAIKGLVVMSVEMEDMYNAFLVQKVPPNWMKCSYPCLKPLNSYVNDAFARMEHLEDWLRNGPPVSFWVSALFFPQGFMTASMQMHARKTKIAIDNLKFDVRVTTTSPADLVKGTVQRRDEGVNMHGLYLQGAGWNQDASKLQESIKGELFVLMPVVWLCPLQLKDYNAISDMKPKRDYDCPVYKTSKRFGLLSTTGHSTNFVMYLQLAYMERDPAHWTRRGTALLCMLDD